MIISGNSNINKVIYSGYTISKIYACGGSLVWSGGTIPPTPTDTYRFKIKKVDNSEVYSYCDGEYSNWTAFDDNLINEYIDSVLKILGYYDNPLKIITKEVSVVSNDTDDNRTYRTEYVTSNPNNFALDGDLTVEHIIEGNYTNVVYYAIKFVAEYNLDEDAPVENNTANDTQNTTNDTNATQNSTSDTNNASNTTNESIAINAADNDGDKNITDNTNIDSKDVAKATGIPFAVLVAALLGVGVSIRRRK